MSLHKNLYPAASFDVDYTAQHDRVSTLFRFFWALPVLVLLGILTSAGGGEMVNKTGEEISRGGANIAIGLFAATATMIIVRKKYPRWWFDFSLELHRFSARVMSYLFLLTDKYPSTTEKQAVHLEFTYPNVEKDLNRWLPIVKWFLAIPHYFVVFALMIAAFFCTVVAWFAILFTGKYPKGLFEFVVGVGRWSTRVEAYAFMLVTDKYPPFSLK